MDPPKNGRPGLDVEEVVSLVGEAVELFGKAGARDQARRADLSYDRRKWHPWAPAFAWYFTLDPNRTSTEVTPVAALVARDMEFLKAIPGLLADPKLTRAAARRILAEREAALEEMRSVGYYNLRGVHAEWTALTGKDTADVLLTDDNIELQMKARKFVRDPLGDEEGVLDLIEKARGQLSGRRPGVCVITLPGVPDWRPWAEKTSSSKFWPRLEGRLNSERNNVISAILLCGDPLVKATSYGAYMWIPTWLIPNDHASWPLPPSFRIWVDDDPPPAGSNPGVHIKSPPNRLLDVANMQPRS